MLAVTSLGAKRPQSGDMQPKDSTELRSFLENIGLSIHEFQAVLRIRIRIHIWSAGSRSRRAKMTPKSEENSSFEVLDGFFEVY
jgi:hypothetical protein